jgi:hypothetical protein
MVSARCERLGKEAGAKVGRYGYVLLEIWVISVRTDAMFHPARMVFTRIPYDSYCLAMCSM